MLGNTTKKAKLNSPCTPSIRESNIRSSKYICFLIILPILFVSYVIWIPAAYLWSTTTYPATTSYPAGKSSYFAMAFLPLSLLFIGYGVKQYQWRSDLIRHRDSSRYALLCVYMRMCVCMRAYVCVCMRMSVCMYVRLWVCVHTMLERRLLVWKLSIVLLLFLGVCPHLTYQSAHDCKLGRRHGPRGVDGHAHHRPRGSVLPHGNKS